MGGFAAETGAARRDLHRDAFGVGVSTTHTITGAIVGVGATRRLSAVRWGLAGQIVWAWILTIPGGGVHWGGPVSRLCVRWFSLDAPPAVPAQSSVPALWRTPDGDPGENGQQTGLNLSGLARGSPGIRVDVVMARGVTIMRTLHTPFVRRAAVLAAGAALATAGCASRATAPTDARFASPAAAMSVACEPTQRAVVHPAVVDGVTMSQVDCVSAVAAPSAGTSGFQPVEYGRNPRAFPLPPQAISRLSSMTRPAPCQLSTRRPLHGGSSTRRRNGMNRDGLPVL